MLTVNCTKFGNKGLLFVNESWLFKLYINAALLLRVAMFADFICCFLVDSVRGIWKEP